MGKYDIDTDDQLTALLLNRDSNAFERIYNKYFPLLYQFSRNILRDDDQAKDTTQDIFTNLLTRIDTLKVSSIESYLYQSTRHNLIDQFRKRKTRIDYIAALKDLYNTGEYTTDNQVIENELRRQIEKQIDNLPPKMKTIFVKSRKLYLSNKEIAAAEGITEQSVKNALQKAMAKLRSGLSSIILLNIMYAILWLHKNQ